jgi:GNAT superfamily N-acetyltransferase
MVMIRQAVRDDLASIARIHSGAVRAIGSAEYTAEQLDAWALPREPASYEQSMRDKEFLVAVDGEAIIGFGVLNRNSSEIQAVYVDPEATGRGVGRALLHGLEDRARAFGLRALCLHASLNAVRFYRRAGYEAVEEICHRLPSGIEIPSVAMTKSLRDREDVDGV